MRLDVIHTTSATRISSAREGIETIRERVMAKSETSADIMQTDRSVMHALAFGAVALGAAAIGAVAVGAIAIGRLRVLEARIETLSVGTLSVDRLNVRTER